MKKLLIAFIALVGIVSCSSNTTKCTDTDSVVNDSVVSDTIVVDTIAE